MYEGERCCRCSSPSPHFGTIEKQQDKGVEEVEGVGVEEAVEVEVEDIEVVEELEEGEGKSNILGKKGMRGREVNDVGRRIEAK